MDGNLDPKRASLRGNILKVENLPFWVYKIILCRTNVYLPLIHKVSSIYKYV